MAFHGKKSWEQPTSRERKTTIHAPLRSIDARDLERERAIHRAEQSEPSHIKGVQELTVFLENELKQHPKILAHAIEAIHQKNPWGFEPIILEALKKAREEHVDEATMNTLRDCFYAGTWLTHHRVTKKDAEKIISTELARTRFQELSDHQEYTMRKALITMDPETSREEKELIGERQASLQNVRDQIDANSKGPELEPSVQHIEDLQIHAFYQLKKFSHAHNITVEEASKRKECADAVKTINNIRPLRDYLYFRRIHPDWIARAER